MEKLNELSRPNFRHIEHNFYICYTQAGFKKAVKHYIGNDGWLYMDQLRGYPTSYPSLVSFSDGYEGYHYPKASCIHLNKIKEYLY